MGKKLLFYYKIFSIVFAAFLLLYVGFRAAFLRASHTAEAAVEYQVLKSKAGNALLAYESMDDEFFAHTMRGLAVSTDGLEILSLSDERVVYYFYARSKDLLLDGIPSDRPLEAPPRYERSVLAHVSAESDVRAPGGGTLTIHAMFRVFSADDLYRVAREAVYIILIFLIVTATVLLILTGLGGAQPRNDPLLHEPVPEPVPETPASPPPPAVQPPAVQPAASPPADSRTAPRSIFSDVSGLVFGDLLPERLRSEIDRAAGSDQDMVLALLGIDDWERIQDKPSVQHALATMVRESFPLKDLSFEQGSHHFAVVLPDTNLDEGAAQLEEFRLRVATAQPSGAHVLISAGVAGRCGRLISESRLLKEATRTLDKAVFDGGNQVIAFRADPDKFRRSLSS